MGEKIIAMINIMIGIAIGAYMFNSSIRWYTNYYIKTAILWAISKIGLLTNKIRGSKTLKRHLISNPRPQARIKNTTPSQELVNGKYACPCGGILEPVLTKGYEGYYACMDCSQVKKLKGK